jgi:hypothetical protein
MVEEGMTEKGRVGPDQSKYNNFAKKEKSFRS